MRKRLCDWCGRPIDMRSVKAQVSMRELRKGNNFIKLKKPYRHESCDKEIHDILREYPGVPFELFVKLRREFRKRRSDIG